jgi:AraC family transcriptional regulator
MSAGASRLRVLLVEDDADIRSLIVDLFDGAMDVDEADDADTARRVLRREGPRFDLMIVDCLLPGANRRPQPIGVDLIGRVHAERPALPIIAITGAVDAEPMILDAFRKGARDLLRKPFRVDEMLAAVARVVPPPARRPPGGRPRTDDRVTRVLALVDEQSGETVRLRTLARAVGLSPSYLSRTFRTVVGIPLRTYLRDRRLDRAQELLQDSSGSSLTEVALDAGFYDLPHFDKAFRARFGMPPSEFVRRRQLVRAPLRRPGVRRRDAGLA